MPTLSSPSKIISGLNAISVPEGKEVGAAASEVPTGEEPEEFELEPPPLPPQLARQETIREESTNLSNFIFIFFKK